MSADRRKQQRLRKLDYARKERRLWIPQAMLDWFGEEYAFDSFWRSFRRAALYWTGFLTLFLVLKLLGGRHGGRKFDDRLHGVLNTAAWAFPMVLFGTAVYSFIGTRYSQRLANVVAAALVTASAVGLIVFIWWTLK